MSPAREVDFMDQPEDIIDRREYPDHTMKGLREALDLITGDHPGILEVGEGAGNSEAAVRAVGGTDDL
jgi:hypothetical protein